MGESFSSSYSANEERLAQALGVADVLLQSALLMGPILLVVRRWQLPPGSLTLKSRKVDARIGPFLGYEVLARRAAGRTRAEAEREVARTVREAVQRLDPEKERRPPARLPRQTVPVEVEP